MNVTDICYICIQIIVWKIQCKTNFCILLRLVALLPHAHSVVALEGGGLGGLWPQFCTQSPVYDYMNPLGMVYNMEKFDYQNGSP